MITHTDRSAVITVLFWQLLLVIDFLKEATNLINFTVIDGDITEVQQAATHLVWRLFPQSLGAILVLHQGQGCFPQKGHISEERDGWPSFYSLLETPPDLKVHPMSLTTTTTKPWET